MEKVKKIIILLLLPTLFIVKTNVYAEDPTDYCAAYIENLNASAKFYGIDTNFCTNNARYKYNTYYATNFRFINVYGVDFKLGYTLVGNSNYDQTPYDYYVLLYNFRYDIYSYLLSKTESNNFPALNNSYEPRISFSKYSFDFSNQNNQARYVTFENSKQNIYAFWGYPTGFNDVSSYCILESNMSGVSFNNQNVSSCTEEQLPPTDSGSSPSPPEETGNLNKIYVPNYQLGQCVEIIDKDTIRVFENEETDIYTDYFVNSKYLSKQGQVDIDYQKNCSDLEFTNERIYSNDFPEILFISICLCGFSLGFIFILLKRFRKR